VKEDFGKRRIVENLAGNRKRRGGEGQLFRGGPYRWGRGEKAKKETAREALTVIVISKKNFDG